MAEIVWNLPSEGDIIDRIEELEECLRNFPESKLVPVWRSEIAQLEAYPVYRGRVQIKEE